MESISEASMLEGCVWGARGLILMSKVAQGTPRVANSHQKSAQRAPRDVPKGREITKSRKLRHLDFERPYGVLATFTAFGGTRAGKNAAEMRTLRNITKKCCFWRCPPPSQGNPSPEGWVVEGRRAKRRGPNVNSPVNPHPHFPPTPAEPPGQHPHCKAELKLSAMLCRAKAE